MLKNMEAVPGNEDTVEIHRQKKMLSRDVAGFFSAAALAQESCERNHSVDSLNDLSIAKINFFDGLDIYRKRNLKPVGKINRENLNKLEEFRDKNWVEKKTIEDLRAILAEMLGWRKDIYNL